MDPQAHQKIDRIADDFVTEDEDEAVDVYTQDELMEMLREAEESGICEQTFEEAYDEIFEKHFGKEKLIEAREARRKG